MRLLKTRVAAALLGPALTVVLATACTSPTAPAGLEKERERLQRNQALWSQANITSYQMRQEISCLCPSELRGPAWVTVRDGAVVSLVLVATGQPVPPEYARYYHSVDGLFSSIQNALDQRFDSVGVAYDPQRGHPIRIGMDGRKEIFDDETLINVSELTPLR